MLILFYMIIFMIILLFFLNIIMKNKIKNGSSMEIECGMMTLTNKNAGSMYYLLFLLIFLIFDLEIILFFMFLFNIINNLYLMFMIIIGFSLLIELFESSLKWND